MDIKFIGFIITACGIIATAHALFERFFAYSLFTTFIDLTPTFIKSYGNELLPAWLDSRISKDKIYHAWDVFLLYLILLSITLFLMVAFWVFLILQLLSIFSIPMIWLIILIIMNIVANVYSAILQTALAIKIKYPEIQSTDEIMTRMLLEQTLTFKLLCKYFFLDFVIGPYNTLKILLLVVLAIILYWPAWIIRMFQRNKLNLSITGFRTTYFIGYAFIFLLVGTILTTFFNN
ncbi:MAG: hypothetical protein ACYDG5_01975 [Dehalococcoidales bacterium]